VRVAARRLDITGQLLAIAALFFSRIR